MSKAPEQKPLRVVSLTAENIKRLKAVTIKFDGPMVQIVGENGQGKTSVLDALWWSLGGKDNIQSTPIRRGAEQARIRVDLGEIVITRTFEAVDQSSYTTKLVVESAEGARFPSPQTMLDKLFGTLTFDPLEFAGKPAAEQAKMLRALVPNFDFEAAEAANRSDFEKRTDLGRDLKRHDGAMSAVVVPEGTPDEPVDDEALASELEKAVEHNAEIERRIERRASVAKGIPEARAAIVAMRVEADKQEAALDETEKKLADAAPLPEPVDVEALRARHREARAKNAGVAAKRQRKIHEDAAAGLKVQIDGLSKLIDGRKEEMARAVAEVDMPVLGLAFGATEVTLGGIPFEQASDAERLRVSTAVAMALNPRLRVIRVRDGSLMDAKTMKVMAEMAKDEGYLVIVERVEPVKGVGVVVEIEDGGVKT